MPLRDSNVKVLKENDLGIIGWIQGTGYTGESGVEIFVPNEQAPSCGKLFLIVKN